MGCTNSSQRSPAASPRPSQSGDIPRFESTSTASTNAHRPNAPLKLPRTCRSGPNTPRTRHDLDRERQAFFDTRVTGRPEIWQAIHVAVDLVRDQRDLATAQGVLDASGITVPRGRLEDGLWDEQGQLYRLEDWIISDPSDLTDDEHEDEDIDSKEVIGGVQEQNATVVGAGATQTEQMHKIKCRLSDRGTDTLITLGKTQKVHALATLVRQQAELPKATKLRFAYLGRILKENETLTAQGWQDGHVISVLVSLPG